MHMLFMAQEVMQMTCLQIQKTLALSVNMALVCRTYESVTSNRFLSCGHT